MRRLVCLSFLVSSIACSANGPTAPDPVKEQVTAPSTPLVVGTPQFIAAPSPDAQAWAVKCSAGGTMEVRYSGEASYARLLTYYTSFDGPAQYAEQWDTVATGNTVTRKFPSCTQGDAEPESGRPAGHCYFDRNGSPASAQDATASCKPTPPPTPPTCVTPVVGTTLSWTGKGDPKTECAAFGKYVYVEQGTYDFLICKAGNDRIVQTVTVNDKVCLNGKDISHVTACACAK